MTVSGERPSLLAHLKRLTSHSAIYGSLDVVAQITNFLLSPLFVYYLGTSGIGALAVVLLFSAMAKVLFRMGLDAGFFRLHYDMDSPEEQRRLAGTVAIFTAAMGAVLFTLAVLTAPRMAVFIGLGRRPGAAFLRLAAAEIYVGTFAFVPLILLRVQGRAALFVRFTLYRNLANTALKVLFVALGYGVWGVLWSDFIATAGLSMSLIPLLARSTRPAFDTARLRELLRFALPKAPHGMMLQILNLADRVIVNRYCGLDLAGIYDKSYNVGTGLKFALTPFETAWQPFIYEQIKAPDARRTIARVVTYAFATFTGIALVLALFGREILTLLTFTAPAFWAGAPVIPWIVLGYLFQALFLLTSIGIGIEKKTGYYPLVTLASAAANLAANFLLVPRFGILGAAWATVLSYAIMALSGAAVSHRLYPLPLEMGRLLRVTLAATVVFALSRLAPAALVPALVLKGAALLLFPIFLFALGFTRSDERAALQQLWRVGKKV